MILWRANYQKKTIWHWALFVLSILALLGCTAAPAQNQHVATFTGDQRALINRLTWGGNDTAWAQWGSQSPQAFIHGQLHPPAQTVLPAEVDAHIKQLQISRESMHELVLHSEVLRKRIDQTVGDQAKQAAHKEYQEYLNTLLRETEQRFVWRAVYSPNQLQEQLTWFWLNHFSVDARKHVIRAMISNYEDKAIRPHVLGHFRDLLAATVYHPAMLAYLDNDKNVAGHINENYARELMELHTLGVNGGYSQQDVQELARILTGLGVERADHPHNPKGKRIIPIGDMVVLNLRKHDAGSKFFLGQKIAGSGKAEIDQVLDILSGHPATAHFVSYQLAQYFTGATPSPALVDAMAKRFLASDGDIAATLQTLFYSTEFAQSLTHGMKDPVHYLVSSLRVLYDNTVIDNPLPAVRGLEKMGEPLYQHLTPDGYSLESSAWTSPGQMTVRFDMARALVNRHNGLLDPEKVAQLPTPKKQFMADRFWQPKLAELGQASVSALAQAKSDTEWGEFFLASPEFMQR